MWPDGEDTTGDSLKSTEKEWDDLHPSVTARGLEKGKELRVLSFSDTPFPTSPTLFPGSNETHILLRGRWIDRAISRSMYNR
jgi:hypothetical protein